MTYYLLPGVDASVEFDKDTKTLVVSGLSETDRIITNRNDIERSQKVTVEFR
jgi:hypothetical protein